MSAPATRAGRALFADMEPGDLWESDGVTPDDIADVEREAAVAALSAARQRVRALSFVNPDAPNGYRLIVPLRAVLDALEAPHD